MVRERREGENGSEISRAHLATFVDEIGSYKRGTKSSVGPEGGLKRMGEGVLRSGLEDERGEKQRSKALW